MRKIFAIAFAVMFALVLLSPTMSSPVQIGNHSSTLKSARFNYTIGVETPSHEPLVFVNRQPYSLKYEALFQPEAKQIGETARSIVIGKSTSAHMATPTQKETSVAPTAQQKFFIQGMVFNDQNGNGKMDSNETSMAGWTVLLKQPTGNTISKFTTNNSGEYSFIDLVAGKYILAEVQNLRWSITAPQGGIYGINLTDNVTGLNFGNEMIAKNAQSVIVTSKNQSNESKILVHAGESIQAAINAATPGDIIEIASGTYKENIIINKPLIIRGLDVGSGLPIIDAAGKKNAVEIFADQVILENIISRNSSDSSKSPGSEGAGIRFSDSDNCSIKGIESYNNYFGINLVDSNNNTISESNISNSDYGVRFFYSNNNTLEHNNVTKTVTPLDIGKSKGNLIRYNIFRNNSNEVETNGENSFKDNNETFIGNKTGVENNCAPGGAIRNIASRTKKEKDKDSGS
jgi:parallel beta-helix repeat protein